MYISSSFCYDNFRSILYRKNQFDFKKHSNKKGAGMTRKKLKKRDERIGIDVLASGQEMAKMKSLERPYARRGQ